MSDSVGAHRRQPTRLRHPWDSPGKNPGVGCHFLLQCRKVKSESEVTQSCLTLHDPMDCSLSGSSIHGIFQARVLEWGAIAFSDTSYPGLFFFPSIALNTFCHTRFFSCVDHLSILKMIALRWNSIPTLFLLLVTDPTQTLKCGLTT